MKTILKNVLLLFGIIVISWFIFIPESFACPTVDNITFDPTSPFSLKCGTTAHLHIKTQSDPPPTGELLWDDEKTWHYEIKDAEENIIAYGDANEDEGLVIPQEMLDVPGKYWIHGKAKGKDSEVFGNYSTWYEFNALNVELDIANTVAEPDDLVAVNGTVNVKARIIGAAGVSATVNFSVNSSTRATIAPTSKNMTVGTDYDLTLTGQQVSDAINDTDLIAKIGTCQQNCEVENFTVLKVELKVGATVINPDDYAYITAAPQMPQLKASLKPTGLAGNAKWRLHIEYKRSPRNDDEYYPGPTASSWTTLGVGATWDIAGEIGTAFRGGKATLYCEYQGVECDQVFHIRGTNPTEAAAEAEIGADPWYAKPIAKWESDKPTQGRYYAQFNTVGTLGPNPSDYKWCPNFGGPNGWGIMQLDPPPTDETLWNWKVNIADGKAHLADPCRTEATTWIAAQEAQQQAEEPGMPLENYVFTFNGVDFQKGTARTPIDACTIWRYNGQGGLWVIYWKNKTPTVPGSWEIQAGARGYVDNVCSQVN